MCENYFLTAEAAQRYHQFRPLLHEIVVERIIDYCFQHNLVNKALDVACGTGHSTYPLRRLAKEVIGVDASKSMLAQAQSLDNISFVYASAEALPFSEQQFDLITVGLAYHWFEQTAFLREVKRVLKPGGWLVIYNNWMTGKMEGDESFAVWVKNRYLDRYPSPSRGQLMAQQEEFIIKRNEESFEVGVEMDHHQLLNYLTTQSNIQQAINEAKDKLSDVENWLASELQAFYKLKSKQAIAFGLRIGYFQLRAA